MVMKSCPAKNKIAPTTPNSVYHHHHSCKSVEVLETKLCSDNGFNECLNSKMFQLHIDEFFDRRDALMKFQILHPGYWNHKISILF